MPCKRSLLEKYNSLHQKYDDLDKSARAIYLSFVPINQ